jgi:hypothetical protein
VEHQISGSSRLLGSGTSELVVQVRVKWFQVDVVGGAQRTSGVNGSSGSSEQMD